MTSPSIRFPDGTEVVLTSADTVLPELSPGTEAAPLPRLCFAAAHVVMRPGYAAVGHRPDAPGSPEAIAENIDIAATQALRARIGSHGFGIAEAMDTAQRFEIGWPAAMRLIEACGELDLPGGFVAGAGCDQLPHADATRNERIDAIVEQIGVIQAAGGAAVILPQAWLCAQNLDADAWVAFYGDVIRAAEGPLVIHWLGEMFHAGMRGAFPADSFPRIMALDPAKVRGCKLSLLDAEFEVGHRQAIAANEQVMFTGDDFNFGQLIVGDGTGLGDRSTHFGSKTAGLGDYSHALLGVFDGIARPAAIALRLLLEGDVDASRELMSRCEKVGQVVFETPTQYYKAGLAFLAWLNGWQHEFALPNGAEHTRDLDHYRRVLTAASAAGVLENVELAAQRLEAWLNDN